MGWLKALRLSALRYRHELWAKTNAILIPILPEGEGRIRKDGGIEGGRRESRWTDIDPCNRCARIISSESNPESVVVGMLDVVAAKSESELAPIFVFFYHETGAGELKTDRSKIKIKNRYKGI